MMKNKTFKLPGFVSIFSTQNLIIPGGNFTWGEALHWDGETIRIPKTKQEVVNILKTAKELQRFRNAVDRPVKIISWFRPSPWNELANGASTSQHKTGRAVDVQVAGYTGKQLREIARKIKWRGGIGIYPPPRDKSLHLDTWKPREWENA